MDSQSFSSLDLGMAETSATNSGIKLDADGKPDQDSLNQAPRLVVNFGSDHFPHVSLPTAIAESQGHVLVGQQALSSGSPIWRHLKLAGYRPVHLLPPPKDPGVSKRLDRLQRTAIAKNESSGSDLLAFALQESSQQEIAARLQQFVAHLWNNYIWPQALQMTKQVIGHEAEIRKIQLVLPVPSLWNLADCLTWMQIVRVAVSHSCMPQNVSVTGSFVEEAISAFLALVRSGQLKDIEKNQRYLILDLGGSTGNVRMFQIIETEPFQFDSRREWAASDYVGAEVALYDYEKILTSAINALVPAHLREAALRPWRAVIRNAFYEFKTPCDIELSYDGPFEPITAKQAATLNKLGWDLSRLPEGKLILKSDASREIGDLYAGKITALGGKVLFSVNDYRSVRICAVGGFTRQKYVQQQLMLALTGLSNYEPLFPKHDKSLVSQGAMIATLAQESFRFPITCNRPRVAIEQHKILEAFQALSPEIAPYAQLHVTASGLGVVEGTAKELFCMRGGNSDEQMDSGMAQLRTLPQPQGDVHYIDILLCWSLAENRRAADAISTMYELRRFHLLNHPDSRIRYIGRISVIINPETAQLINSDQLRNLNMVNFIISTSWADTDLKVEIKIPLCGHFHERFDDVCGDPFIETPTTCTKQCESAHPDLHASYGQVNAIIHTSETWRADQMGDSPNDRAHPGLFSETHKQVLYSLDDQAAAAAQSRGFHGILNGFGDIGMQH